MGQRSQPIIVVLEQIRIDSAYRNPLLGGERGQLAEVVHPVPRNVQRHLGRHPVNAFTCAASAIFSNGSLGVPGVVNTLKRVPELP
jgi:hypothetical protein